LISIDTLRADRLSLYGYERSTTPHLEALSHGAVVFERFYNSGGGTLPSHLSIMTSLFPFTHDVTPENGKSLAEGWTTLAEELKAAGYSTAGFVDNGWMKGKLGFAQGFDVYDDEGGGFERILPRARAWLEARSAEPFFLFLHTYDVHSDFVELPYECPDEYHYRYTGQGPGDFKGCRGGRCASELLAWTNTEIRAGRMEARQYFSGEEVEFLSSLYDGCINYVDDRLADFFGLLRELGLYESSLVLVTSDHGEEFAEHGMFIHDQGGYEELARIPLLMKLPFAALGGRRVRHLAATVDLMPTILDLLDLPAPEQMQGHSLLPAVLRDEAVRNDIHMYTALTTEDFKLLSEPRELYDLHHDLTEQRNLYAAEREKVAELRFLLEARIAEDRKAQTRFEKQWGAEPAEVELTPDEVKRLKALGYLQ
jgi:arylsulfatase